MRAQDLLAESVLACKPLVSRYYAGFDDSNHTAQPPSLPNHLAWSLGHLALTMSRVCERLDGRPLPASDFGPVAQPPTTFNPESVAFKSQPVATAATYPPLARCIQIFETACDRLAAAVRAASDAKLAEVVPWGAGQTSLAMLVQRMVFHNGTHTGQIADLRRAMGFRPVLG